MLKRVLIVLTLLALVLGLRDWNQRAIDRPPGVRIDQQPQQFPVAVDGPVFVDGFLLHPRAGFELRARVLSREDYFWGLAADLAPMDLALGWGAMSDQAVLDRIDVSQWGRWYHTRYELPAPIADAEIIRSSSNMHVIPANEAVHSKLKRIRRGDFIRAAGLLVDADHDSGFRWRTSLSREDTGNGSCELFYVERLEIEGRP